MSRTILPPTRVPEMQNPPPTCEGDRIQFPWMSASFFSELLKQVEQQPS